MIDYMIDTNDLTFLFAIVNFPFIFSLMLLIYLYFIYQLTDKLWHYQFAQHRLPGHSRSRLFCCLMHAFYFVSDVSVVLEDDYGNLNHLL